MAVYTVHQPPLRATDAAPDPQRFVFVRDGFYFWAFLPRALWMLWHRMWLVLLIYVVGAIGGRQVRCITREPAAVGAVVVVLLIAVDRHRGGHAAALHAGAPRLEECRCRQRR